MLKDKKILEKLKKIKCANVAYAQLADLSDEYKIEIRNVYRRIEAETK